MNEIDNIFLESPLAISRADTRSCYLTYNIIRPVNDSEQQGKYPKKKWFPSLIESYGSSVLIFNVLICTALSP